MRYIRILGIITLGAVFTLVGGGGEMDFSAPEMEKLRSIIANVKRYYHREIDNSSLFKKAIDGMLSGLDPHSSYLDEGDLKGLQVETTGRFGGLGIEIFSDAGFIRVLSPLDGTPASRAGIKTGDLIVQIDGKSIRDLELKEVLNMMRGRPGSKVKLTIVRYGKNKPMVVTLTREIIRMKTVRDKMLESGYGYLRIALFQEPTLIDMINAIRKMEDSGKGRLKGLILDLRNNPGGLLESSVQIADSFLDADKLKGEKLIVYTKGRTEDAKILVRATPGDIFEGKPIVVIINEGSASAAEIVAGALQDHARAIVVGGRSFGKGSVQTVIPIDEKSAIKITTAIYYTPKGRSIQAKGIDPDIVIEDIQLSAGATKELPRFDEASLVDHIRKMEDKDEGKIKGSEGSKSGLELAREDYQLYEALHILKSQNFLQKM